MAGRGPNNASLKERLLGELKRDRKKVAILGVLLTVLVVVGGREVLKRLRPAKAGAAVTPAPARSEADSVAGAGRTPPAGLNDKDGGAGESNGLPALQNLVVDRDLFTPNPIFYPPRQKRRPAPKVTPVDDAAARREAEKRAVQAQAQALTLQSTVVGAVPTAIVNGRVLRVGDWITGFRVVEIGSRTCIIEKQSMRVTLEMSK